MVKTILLSSHIFSEIDATCDRICIIKDGRIVSEFIANDLKHSSIKKIIKITFADKNAFNKFINDNSKKMNLLRFLNIVEDKKIMFLIATNDKDINKVIDYLANYEMLEFNNIKETLEDYFMKFYKEDKTFGGVSK
ncbi:MAG: hypothetical protein L6U99_13660 [Clostridium sp.]|nr:MAG: hypothetical protein L6U99_13660 [Clostridium sp.]